MKNDFSEFSVPFSLLDELFINWTTRAVRENTNPSGFANALTS